MNGLTPTNFDINKYSRFEVDPNMIVSIQPNWLTMDDYLYSMKNKYRRGATKAIKKGQPLKRVAFTVKDITKWYDRIDELYGNVAKKASFRIVHITPDYFIQLMNELGDDFEFTGYFIADKLVGFTCSIFWGNNLEGHTIGIDYEFNTQYAVYQNILYDDIKTAIIKKKKRVIYGRHGIRN